LNKYKFFNNITTNNIEKIYSDNGLYILNIISLNKSSLILSSVLNSKTQIINEKEKGILNLLLENYFANKNINLVISSNNITEKIDLIISLNTINFSDLIYTKYNINQNNNIITTLSNEQISFIKNIKYIRVFSKSNYLYPILIIRELIEKKILIYNIKLKFYIYIENNIN